MKRITLRDLMQRVARRLRDPYNIDRDWDDFNAMTEDELREEYRRLLADRPCSDRLRRLCQCISLRWVYASNASHRHPSDGEESGQSIVVPRRNELPEVQGSPVGREEKDETVLSG